MISATFVQFQTSTSFPKCSKKSLLPTFDLTCPPNSLSFAHRILLNRTLFKILQWPRPHSDLSILYWSLILLPKIHKCFGFDGLPLNWSSSHLSSRGPTVSINAFNILTLFALIPDTVPDQFHSCLHCFLLTIVVLLVLMISRNSLNIHCISCTLMIPSFTSFTLTNSVLYIFWNTYHHFHCHSLLDELELTALQSIENCIPCYWQKTTTSQICWSHKQWYQQWYYPSQFLCLQSWFHLCLWHVFLWINQLCI